MKDVIIGKGCLDLKLTKASGEVVEWHVPNLVVTTGRNHIANQLSSLSEDPMSHMAIGDSDDTAIISQTTLSGTELSRKAFTSKTQGAGSEANKVVFNASWAPGEGTGAIREAGLFNAAVNGEMLTRTTFDVQNKSAGDSLSIQWTLTITG